MNTYSLSDAAIRDLDEICEYIALQNSKAASQLFDRIRQKCKLVADFPNMGKNYNIIAPNIRGFIVDDYIVLYYPRENGINIAIAILNDLPSSAIPVELGKIKFLMVSKKLKQHLNSSERPT